MATTPIYQTGFSFGRFYVRSAGIDILETLVVGKRTYEMCIISRRDREEIIPLLKGYEKDEAGGALKEKLQAVFFQREKAVFC